MSGPDDRHRLIPDRDQPARIGDLASREFVEDDDVAAVPEVVRTVPLDVAHRRESTRANLALGLTVILALVVLAVAISPMIGGSLEATERVAGLLLSPLFGLVGAATGFYYGGRNTG